MIELKNITSGYNGMAIINNINLFLKKGTITTVIGKNGCGKSTLLKTASNLLKPLSGDIILNGESIFNCPENRIARQISFLPQIRNVPNISVSSLIMHGRFPYLGFPRIPQKKDREIVEEAMDKMKIAMHRNKNMQELSGGERQKVYLAMLLAQDTDLIFLDEPTTYLDIHHQLEILEIIKDLKAMGKTIAMVLHDLSSALSYSDMVCLMENGTIAIYNTPEAVFESKEINRVFNVSCERVYLKNMLKKEYIFSLL